jgi:Na+/H+ antiporter NhaD/arsenite permease-like protein
MLIAGVLRRTGVVGCLAARTVRVARGEPLAILLLLSAVIAVISAFLDNVTAIVILISTLGLLWVSGAASALVDNIPKPRR